MFVVISFIININVILY